MAKIPVIALVDSNSDPSVLSHPILGTMILQSLFVLLWLFLMPSSGASKELKHLQEKNITPMQEPDFADQEDELEVTYLKVTTKMILMTVRRTLTRRRLKQRSKR